MARTKDSTAIEARKVRSLIKLTKREKTSKAFAASKSNLEYYDLGWMNAADQILQNFERLVKEHGFD